MKKIYLLSILFMFTAFDSEAQRSAYVDMEKIMNSVKDYELAQRELEQKAERWRQEIAKEYDQIENMYREFQVREPLLSDEMRKSKHEEIVNKEKAVRSLQRSRFGPDGELFKKRQSLVKPLQEKIYNEIQKIAKERKYDFIFSAPDGSSIIYASDDKDLTAEVIKRLAK
ncbi:MAG: OmpH family outer membrane protein [Saprospiraceae bacterium]|nr:OmpH family outer membrane protein [Saprospiraceae bacterium]